MENNIFDTSDLKIVAYVLVRENECLSYKESSGKTTIQFKKTQQLDQYITDYYSRKKIALDGKRLLDILSDLKFGLHHPEVLDNLLKSFEIRKDN